MKKTVAIMAAAIALLSGACGSGNNSGKDFPKEFASMSDTQKMAWMMEHNAPDSVAHFICDASLDLIDGAKIDSFPNAVLYAYENYHGDSLTMFCTEFEAYSAALPLDRKMKIYTLAGKTDPMGLGYQLGLEYVANIRRKKMTADQVASEIEAFKKACGADTETYDRFYKGFQIALKADSGIELDPKIKARFL